jgi:putative hydrolase of the HAD superfamily
VAIRVVVFDWGDTVMRNLPGQCGPMANWPMVQAVAGVGEVLSALRPAYHLALATNAQDSGADLVRAALRRVRLGDAFDSLFTARDLGAAKPDPRFYQVLVTRLGYRPREMVMVGDDYTADVTGAKDAGWQAIWFNPARAVCPDRYPRHDAEVAAMADLPSALERLCSSGPVRSSG